MLLKKKIPLFVILIPIIVFIFFLPSLSNGFVNWDDPDIFWGNPLVKNFSWSSIQHIFKVMWAGQYHRFIPLTMVLFDAEYHFFGLNPLGYHCVSVLFHSINSLGVFVLIYFLTDKIGISVFRNPACYLVRCKSISPWSFFHFKHTHFIPIQIRVFRMADVHLGAFIL